MTRILSGRPRSMARGLALAAAGLGGMLAVAAPASADQAPRDPVLFVHGFTRSSADFATFEQRFLAKGYRTDQLFTIDYNSFADNAVTAGLISDKVDQILAQTGKKHVDIVAHSMGAYGTRYLLKHLGGQPKVDAFVSIAGPNHGTVAADNDQCKAVTSCAQMVPGSPFLTDLNNPDETPNNAKVRYFTIRSVGDELVIPSISTQLDGACNWVNPNQTLTHQGLLEDQPTIDKSAEDIANS